MRDDGFSKGYIALGRKVEIWRGGDGLVMLGLKLNGRDDHLRAIAAEPRRSATD